MDYNLQDANKRFQKKKKDEVLQFIPAEFHTQVEEALDYEEKEEYEKVIESCQAVLKLQDIEQVKIIMARVYPRMLRMDIDESNQKYQKHVAEFFEFLDSVNMNDLMQEYVVETMVRLCEVMENDWYRPLFKEFVDTVKEKKYLTKEIYQRTLESAYASIEAFYYYNDSRVSMMLRSALKAGYDRAYTLKDETLDHIDSTMEIDVLTYDWYMSQYYEGHEEEVAYVAEQYPYSYALIEELIEKIKADRSKAAEEVLEKLMLYVADGVDKEKLQETMTKSYEQLLEKVGKPQMVASGTSSYQRANKKIGRNDLCPCGSGKKYKLCCGR